MTMPSKTPPSDEQYRREFRAIFAETGHRALNALLIVSGGATIAFLSFLGSAFKESEVAGRIGPIAAKGFILAIQFFVASVACSVLAHGTTFLSHGAYHFRHDKTGFVLMVITALLALACIFAFVYGSYAAIGAFGASIEGLIKRGNR
jgi:hypothetical protein